MHNAGLVSLIAHTLVVLALLAGHLLVGRAPLTPPTEPAAIEIFIGEGGDTDQPATTAPEQVPRPAEEPSPQITTAAQPSATPPTPDPTAQPPSPMVPQPASPTVPAVVQLGDIGGRPHADLLDPDKSRFRPATQDTGNRPPAYPREAAARLEAGTVRLQLFVDPAGRVTNVLVAGSSGSARLDQAARDQLATWRFTPARRDGRVVPEIVEIEIKFELL